jgi:hypothetical protein
MGPRFWYFLRGMIRGWLLFGCFNGLYCALILLLVGLGELEAVGRIFPGTAGFAVWEILVITLNLIWLGFYVPYKAKKVLLSSYQLTEKITKWKALPYWLPGLVAGALAFAASGFIMARILSYYMWGV